MTWTNSSRIPSKISTFLAKVLQQHDVADSHIDLLIENEVSICRNRNPRVPGLLLQRRNVPDASGSKIKEAHHRVCLRRVVQEEDSLIDERPVRPIFQMEPR